MITHSAARLAIHAATHGRSPTRRTERASTTMNTAITTAEAICAVVLQRQRSSYIRRLQGSGGRAGEGVSRSGNAAAHARAACGQSLCGGPAGDEHLALVLDL